MPPACVTTVGFIVLPVSASGGLDVPLEECLKDITVGRDGDLHPACPDVFLLLYFIGRVFLLPLGISMILPR